MDKEIQQDPGERQFVAMDWKLAKSQKKVTAEVQQIYS